MAPSRASFGDVAAMACYAGQSVGAVRSVQSPAEIIAELFGRAEQQFPRQVATQAAEA